MRHSPRTCADDAPAPAVGSGAHGDGLRKAGHIGVGGFALTLRWLEPWQAALGTALAVAFNLLLLHRLTRSRLLRPDERAAGFSRGIVLYPAAVLGAILVFHRRLELAAAVWGNEAMNLATTSIGAATACLMFSLFHAA